MLNKFIKAIKRKHNVTKIRHAIEVLQTLDKAMIGAGYSRQVRRRVWLAMSKDTNETIKTLKNIIAAGPS